MPLSQSNLDEIERMLGVILPGLYRKLLVEIGPGELLDTCEIYHPKDVHELYAPFFEDPSQLCNPYFPFGCDNHEQTVWVIDAHAELAASIWHETVPEDWPEEEWLAYDQWVERLFDVGNRRTD